MEAHNIDAYFKHLEIWNNFNLQMSLIKINTEFKAQEQRREHDELRRQSQREEFELQVRLFNERKVQDVQV